MAKIQRKYLAHFINTAAPNGAAAYERLGRDLEEFSPKLSARVETVRNILGQTSVSISGYEKTAEVKTFYAEADSALFDRLQGILDGDLVLEDLKTDLVEVRLWQQGADGRFPAVREEVYVEILSYGGSTTGYQIPFKLHFTGVKQRGYFHPGTKIFTPEGA